MTDEVLTADGGEPASPMPESLLPDGPQEAEVSPSAAEEEAPVLALQAQGEPLPQPAELPELPEGETEMPAPPLGLQPEAGPLPPETAIPTASTGAVPTPVPAPPAGWVTRGQAVLLAFVSGLFALILALTLSLGILAALNNGRLQFATPAQVNRLSVQIDGLDSRAGSLEGDLQSLRTRVANLEPLGGRVDTVEASTQKLGTDLEALTGQMNDISGQVEALQAQSNRFQGFVDGLRTLLNNLFAPGGEGK